MPGDDGWSDVEEVVARGGSIKTVPPEVRSGKAQKPDKKTRTCKKRRNGTVCGKKLSSFNREDLCFACQGESPW